MTPFNNQQPTILILLRYMVLQRSQHEHFVRFLHTTSARTTSKRAARGPTCGTQAVVPAMHEGATLSQQFAAKNIVRQLPLVFQVPFATSSSRSYARQASRRPATLAEAFAEAAVNSGRAGGTFGGLDQAADRYVRDTQAHVNRRISPAKYGDESSEGDRGGASQPSWSGNLFSNSADAAMTNANRHIVKARTVQEPDEFDDADVINASHLLIPGTPEYEAYQLHNTLDSSSPARASVPRGKPLQSAVAKPGTLTRGMKVRDDDADTAVDHVHYPAYEQATQAARKDYTSQPPQAYRDKPRPFERPRAQHDGDAHPPFYPDRPRGRMKLRLSQLTEYTTPKEAGWNPRPPPYVGVGANGENVTPSNQTPHTRVATYGGKQKNWREGNTVVGPAQQRGAVGGMGGGQFGREWGVDSVEGVGTQVLAGSSAGVDDWIADDLQMMLWNNELKASQQYEASQLRSFESSHQRHESSILADDAETDVAFARDMSTIEKKLAVLQHVAMKRGQLHSVDKLSAIVTRDADSYSSIDDVATLFELEARQMLTDETDVEFDEDYGVQLTSAQRMMLSQQEDGGGRVANFGRVQQSDVSGPDLVLGQAAIQNDAGQYPANDAINNQWIDFAQQKQHAHGNTTTAAPTSSTTIGHVPAQQPTPEIRGTDPNAIPPRAPRAPRAIIRNEAQTSRTMQPPKETRSVLLATLERAIKHTRDEVTLRNMLTQHAIELQTAISKGIARPADVANTIFAFGRVGYTSDAFYDEVANHVARTMTTYSGTDIGQILMGYAWLRYHNVELVAAITQHLVRDSVSLSGDNVKHILLGLARQSNVPHELLARLASSAQSIWLASDVRAKKQDVADLVHVLWALMQHNYTDSSFQVAAYDHVNSHIKLLDPLHTCTLLHALNARAVRVAAGSQPRANNEGGGIPVGDTVPDQDTSSVARGFKGLERVPPKTQLREQRANALGVTAVMHLTRSFGGGIPTEGITLALRALLRKHTADDVTSQAAVLKRFIDVYDKLLYEAGEKLLDYTADGSYNLLCVAADVALLYKSVRATKAGESIIDQSSQKMLSNVVHGVLRRLKAHVSQYDVQQAANICESLVKLKINNRALVADVCLYANKYLISNGVLDTHKQGQSLRGDFDTDANYLQLRSGEAKKNNILKFSETSEQNSPPVHPADVMRLLTCAVTQLDYLDSQFLANCDHVLRTHAHLFTLSELTNYVVVCNHVRHVSSDVLASICAQFGAQGGALTDRDWVHVVGGLSQLGWFIARDAIAVIGDRGREVVAQQRNALHDVARHEPRQQWGFTSISGQVGGLGQDGAAHYTTRQVGHVCWSLGFQGYADVELFSELYGYVDDYVSRAGDGNVANDDLQGFELAPAGVLITQLNDDMIPEHQNALSDVYESALLLACTTNQHESTEKGDLGGVGQEPSYCSKVSAILRNLKARDKLFAMCERAWHSRQNSMTKLSVLQAEVVTLLKESGYHVQIGAQIQHPVNILDNCSLCVPISVNMHEPTQKVQIEDPPPHHDQALTTSTHTTYTHPPHTGIAFQILDQADVDSNNHVHLGRGQARAMLLKWAGVRAVSVNHVRWGMMTSNDQKRAWLVQQMGPDEREGHRRGGGVQIAGSEARAEGTVTQW